ncbi:hypothetical protein TRFO_19929 [Tritrichomonas foetus]|uniref:Uncharacterized protein n=1 Tax=Tritrichomonas foetus TaxID=1144522 RepID=A0A1J4KH12_9EUKA|nr:hypothetical protein TRFO_19929 [Tritrichomonas foetus]|eukprot:OHT10711.1 hypothetical protein TRFO_19929 [Tritrichomonas foetus]
MTCPASQFFATKFLEWTKKTQFEQIIHEATTDMLFLQILKPDFEFDLFPHRENQVTIELLHDFLLKEGANDISFRDVVFYIVISAVSNSKFNQKDVVHQWIKNLDHLSLLFDFKKDHCYLLSFAWTLEKEDKDYPLFRQMKIFPRIQDITLSDSYIKFFMHELVEKELYHVAVNFYNNFIDRKITDPQTQVDVVISLTATKSAVPVLTFIRENSNKKENIAAMVQTIKNSKCHGDFVHLPFDENEVSMILNEIKYDSEFKKLFLQVRNRRA